MFRSFHLFQWFGFVRFVSFRVSVYDKFRSLSYHDSIIKIFCSGEQSASHVHAHAPFHQIKGFDKRFMAFSREFALFFVFFFLVSLFNCFDHILSKCSIIQYVGPCFHVIMKFMDSDEELFRTKIVFREKY